MALENQEIYTPNEFTPGLDKISPEVSINDVNINLPTFDTPKLTIDSPIISFAGGEYSAGSLEALMANALPAMGEQHLGKNATANTAVYTSVLPALRYKAMDSDGLGYDAFDPNLEDTYARYYKWANFGHNLVGFGTKALGTFAQSILTIPIALNALVSWDFNKMTDNAVSNSINEWMKEVDESLPTFRTNYQNEHPILQYFNITDFASFLGAWGGQINNFGFTVGAIAGALIETAIITALTGGGGFFPALAKNVAMFTLNTSRLSRGIALAPRLLKGADAVLDARNISNIVSGADRVAHLRQVVATKNSLYKIRDSVRYNLSLLTSATSEGTFEAKEVEENTYKHLLDQYIAENGTMPDEAWIQRAKKLAKDSGNITLIGNIGVLYLSNRLNFGSLFKPTSQALKSSGKSVITGWGKNIGRTSIETTLDKGKIVYKTVTKKPETILGKIYLNSNRVVRAGSMNLTEAGEEGAQFMLSTAAEDFAFRKYDLSARNDISDFFTSLSKGFKETFTTNEGIENLMAGFVGGFLGGGLNRVVGGKQMSKLEQINRDVKTLNSSQLSDIFSLEEALNIYKKQLSDPTFKAPKGFEGKLEELTTQLSLAREHEAKIKEGDIKGAKDIQNRMAINHWMNAKKAGVFDARKEELEIIKGLEGESFTDYWQLEYNEENVSKVNSFIDKQLKQADIIAKNTELILNIRGKNPHDKNKNPFDYRAYEDYTDTIIYNASMIDLVTDRIDEITQNLLKLNPTLNIQEAFDLTSLKGLRKISNSINDAIKGLNSQIQDIENISYDDRVLTAPNKETVSELKRKLEALQKLKDRLDNISQSHENSVQSKSFIGEEFVSVLNDLWALYNGTGLTNNEYVNKNDFLNNLKRLRSPDELADGLNKLQDLYDLIENKLSYQRMYNYLRSGKGETEFSKKQRAFFERIAENFELSENGSLIFKGLQEDEAEKIREEELEGIDHPEEMEASEREILKKAARTSPEEWTEEQNETVNKYPEVFEEYKKAEERAQERISEINTNTLNEILGSNPQEQEVRSNLNISFYGITPQQLLLRIHNNEAYLVEDDKNSKDNMFNIIFTSGKPFSLKHVTGKLVPRPAVQAVFDKIEKSEIPLLRSVASKKESEYTKEEIDFVNKYPNIVEEYKDAANNYTAITYKLNNKTIKTNLYRRDSSEVIVLRYEGKVIGELRQPDSLYYKDANGNFIKIIDSEGNLLIDEKTYSQITSNTTDTFQDFKEQVEKYSKAYKELFNKATTEELTALDFIKHFRAVISPGIVSTKNKASEDTLLTNSEIKNAAHIVRLTPVYDTEGNITSFVKEEELENKKSVVSKAAKENINRALDNPEMVQILSKMMSKDATDLIVAIVPINDEITPISFIKGRLNEGTEFKASNIRLAAPARPFEQFSISFFPKDTHIPNVSKNVNANNSRVQFPKDVAKLNIRFGKHLIYFKGDIDRALLAISTKNSIEELGEIPKKLIPFLFDNVRDVNGKPLTEAQLFALAKNFRNSLTEYLKDKSTTQLIYIEEDFYKNTSFENTQEPLSIKLVANLKEQPAIIQQEVLGKANKDSVSFKLLEETIKSLGYNVVYLKDAVLPANPKPYTVYLHDEYIAYVNSKGEVIESDNKTFIHQNPDNQSLINSLNLYTIFSEVLTDNIKEEPVELFNSNDLSKQPLVIQETVKQKEDSNSVGYKSILNKLTSLGYTFKTVSKTSDIKNFKPNDIYYVKDENTLYVFDENSQGVDSAFKYENNSEGLWGIYQKDFSKNQNKNETKTNTSNTTTNTNQKSQTNNQSSAEAQIAEIERRSGESVEDFINRLFENNYLVEVDGKRFFSLTQGRWGIVVNINGVKVPFYQSTSGTDTKIVGQWYPFFGDLGNWLIKGNSDDSNIGYGFKAIQDVQSFLNRNIKERDAIAISDLIPTVVNQNKDDLRKLDEDKIKGNEKISLNREATAKRLSELLGYTVEEGRKTKSDAELFALASKKVFSEIAALEGTTTSSELQSEIDKVNERRKEDLAKLDTLKKEVGDAFSGHSSTTDLLTAIGKFFVTNFGWKFEGNREYSIYVSKERNRTELDINGLEVNLPEGATVGVMGGSHYARFTPQEIIEAKYDAEIAALESKSTTSSGNAVQTPSQESQAVTEQRTEYEIEGSKILEQGGAERLRDWLSNQPLLGGFNGIRDIANKIGIEFPQTEKEFDAEVKKVGGIDVYMGHLKFADFYKHFLKISNYSPREFYEKKNAEIDAKIRELEKMKSEPEKHIDFVAKRTRYKKVKDGERAGMYSFKVGAKTIFKTEKRLVSDYVDGRIKELEKQKATEKQIQFEVDRVQKLREQQTTSALNNSEAQINNSQSITQNVSIQEHAQLIKQQIRDVFGPHVGSEEVEVAIALFDTYAMNWAARNGKTADEFYQRFIDVSQTTYEDLMKEAAQDSVNFNSQIREIERKALIRPTQEQLAIINALIANEKLKVSCKL